MLIPVPYWFDIPIGEYRRFNWTVFTTDTLTSVLGVFWVYVATTIEDHWHSIQALNV